MQWQKRMFHVSWTQQQGSCCSASRPCRVWWWSADWSRVFGLRARQATGRMGRQTHRGDIPSGASTDWHWPQGLSNVPFNGETVNKVRVARPHSCRSLGPSGTSKETQRRDAAGTQQDPQSASAQSWGLHTAQQWTHQCSICTGEGWNGAYYDPLSASVFFFFNPL